MNTAQLEIGRAILAWVLDGIQSNADAIAPIICNGDVAVFVVNPAPNSHDFALSLGWDGQSSAFRLGSFRRRRFATGLAGIGDHVAARWLHAERDGRIFVIVEGGNLLVNFDPDRGFWLEPGSTDTELDLGAGAQA